ncbi:hypothetical protein GCM10009702_07020 [Propioniferax innocua]
MLGEYVEQVGRAIGDALMLRPDLAGSGASVGGVTTTIGILVAISMLAGRGAMLAINRVRGLSYLFLLLTTVVSVAVVVGLLAGILWSLGWALGVVVGFGTMANAVALAASPGVFAFVVIAPGVGPFLSRGLMAWSFLILWSLTGQVFGVDVPMAFLMSLAASVATLALVAVLGGPASRVRNNLWRRLTGRELRRSSRELMDIEGILEMEG